MDILMVAVVGTLNVVCFLIGAKVGQTVNNGKDIKVPTINPVKAYHEYLDKAEARREQERIDTIIRNIERYDGTDAGQEDVPR